jgi:hypothetical protein
MDIFKPFPVRQVFLLLDPPGVQFSGETPGKAALKVQASRIGSLTAPENGRCRLAQLKHLKLQSLQHIPSNDFDLAEHRDNHSILGFESSFSILFSYFHHHCHEIRPIPKILWQVLGLC